MLRLDLDVAAVLAMTSPAIGIVGPALIAAFGAGPDVIALY